MTLKTPKNPIKLRVEVLEEDKTVTFGPGEDTSIGGASGNLFFIGMEGSGRRELARQAAERLGLTYGEAPDAPALARAAAGSGQSVAVIGEGLADPEQVQAMRASGKVFFVMRGVADLARNLGDPARAEELAAETARLEPMLMEAAHFIVPVDAAGEERIEDVVWKAGL
ncbi:hypothetical protein [Fundidesulfovibrio agrisoli]|uniref:hypothetical protein n=1 Tax=Fundidesulfovibrio agrisoli TaxID=2922717 RepID=UPI001FAE5A2A|nr:hypothetical protein [Fundidesulfovibrio agrisoli]